MNDEHVDRWLTEIERRLRIDDPAFVARVERGRRGETTRAVLVIALMSSAVLLTVGLATVSPIPYCAGVAAFLAALLVERRPTPYGNAIDRGRSSRS